MNSRALATRTVAAAVVIAGCGSGAATARDGSTGAADTAVPETAPAVDQAPGVTMSCGDPNQPIDPTALIDDMEDGNFAIARVSGRNGSWWAGGDMTPGGAMVPAGDAPPEMVPGGRCGSRYAMHVTGQGFTDWGAVLSLSFRYGSADGSAPGLLPYDARARAGITFWARIGDTSTDQVRYAVSDEHARPEAGICVLNGPPGQTCYDTFGVDLTQLGTGWKQYRIPFAGLIQRDFGVHADTIDTQMLYTIEFAFGPGAIFDFWLDDIAFY